MDRDKVLEKLKKVRALALLGSTEDERSTARKLFDNLVDKYEISLRELDDLDEEVKGQDFWYHGEDERRILVQVMYMVTDVGAYYELSNPSTGRKRRTKIRKDCTDSQKLEIEFLFEFYRDLWYREKDLFLSAFFQKHQLFGNSSENSEAPSRSLEETRRIFQMTRVLSDKSPLKAIESGDDKS